MNIVLWVLQIIIALHTLTGAIWKFSNAEQAVPSLNILPHSVWLLLSVIEIICAIVLIIPAFKKTFMKWVSWAAGFIAFEMILFCGIHLASGDRTFGPIIYWAVTALICAFLAFKRRG